MGIFRALRMHLPPPFRAAAAILYRACERCWQRRSAARRAEAKYLQDKFCEKPFTDFEITHNGNVFVCCPNYLSQPIGNVKQASGEQLLNSSLAMKSHHA